MTATPGPDPVLLVGVDVGTSAVKADAVRPDGTLVAVASRPTPPLDGPADALVATALSVVRDTVDATGAARVAAVGVAGMAETGVPLDADLRPLGPLVAWTDRRSAVDADAIAARLGAAEVYAITGLTPGPKRPLTTWHRLRRTAPGVLDRMRVWAHAVELAAFGLTGVVATEASLAARTMAYDIVARCWHDALLAEAGLDPGRLPPVVPPGAAVGTVTPAAAAATGLRAGVPVVLAGHDHAVGATRRGCAGPVTSRCRSAPPRPPSPSPTGCPRPLPGSPRGSPSAASSTAGPTT